jgi:alkylhydroperoxidase/carboxymuconolactone decarboxylase family protein YurZ
MTDVAHVLAPDHLAALRDAYSADEMTRILGAFFPHVHPPTTEYIAAVMNAFYAEPSPDAVEPRPVLPAIDRERCLIAILAGRGADLNFAIHVYMGLMHGLAPDEIANVLFLVGVYTGVDNFAQALKAELTVLGTLAALAADGSALDPASVLTALQRAFSGPATIPRDG